MRLLMFAYQIVVHWGTKIISIAQLWLVQLNWCWQWPCCHNHAAGSLEDSFSVRCIHSQLSWVRVPAMVCPSPSDQLQRYVDTLTSIALSLPCCFIEGGTW